VHTLIGQLKILKFLLLSFEGINSLSLCVFYQSLPCIMLKTIVFLSSVLIFLPLNSKNINPFVKIKSRKFDKRERENKNIFTSKSNWKKKVLNISRFIITSKILLQDHRNFMTFYLERSIIFICGLGDFCKSCELLLLFFLFFIKIWFDFSEFIASNTTT